MQYLQEYDFLLDLLTHQGSRADAAAVDFDHDVTQ
jgi:hypothetical protein